MNIRRLVHLTFVLLSYILTSTLGQNYFKDFISGYWNNPAPPNPYEFWQNFQRQQQQEPASQAVFRQQYPGPGPAYAPLPPTPYSPQPIPPARTVLNENSAGLFKPCKSNPLNGQLFNITVNPCVGKGYCTLQRGTNSTLEFEFFSYVPSQTLSGKLSGMFGWFSVPFGSAEDLCLYSGISCPIQPGQIYKVKKIIPVSMDFPSLELDTKLQVYGDKKGDIGCILIPVKIM